MTERRSPLEEALDLLLYAPLGLALTAREELPKLAEKGRAQISGQVNMAKMVGQFAVAQARKDLERRFGRAQAPASAPTSSSPSDWAHEAAGPHVTGPVGTEPASNETVVSETAATAPMPAEESTVAWSGVGQSGVGTAGETSVNGAGSTPRAAKDLAIPGYDSLSASQVVQRLAGLSHEELAEVGDYESGHRRRRTILNRVSQLQEG